METSNKANEFKLVTLKSGLKSLRSLDRNETFHPTSGPWGEAMILHTEQQRIVERSATAKQKRFVIWDVGFGAAANVLSAIGALQSARSGAHVGASGNAQVLSLPEIEIHSFDQSLDAIEFALLHSDELGYLLDYERPLRQLLSDGNVDLPGGIQWKLHLGDFSKEMKTSYQSLASPHAIFFDPYSAASNPEMWTLETFSLLWQKLNPLEDCLWTNYTRSTAVRVALLLAGFSVGIGHIIGEKAETTIASNSLNLLEKPLTRTWLERVRNSTNSAPLRTDTYSTAKISDEDFARLERLPQFLES